MRNIKDQKDIGNIDQNMEQFLHKESKKIFLAHKTGKYDGVPDQSTKKKNHDSTKWYGMSDSWSVPQKNMEIPNAIFKSCS